MSAHGSSAGRRPDGTPRRRGGPRGVAGGLFVSSALAAIAALVLSSTSGRAASDAAATVSTSDFPGGSYFALSCGSSHRNNDDPIVFPGQPGRSHNHTFFGNRAVTATTTPATLVDGPSTCELDADASAYWVPTLYARGRAVGPLAGIVYYVRRTSEPVLAHPAGLRMVAGNADARTRQPKGIVAWSCGGIGMPPRFHVPPRCAPNQLLQLRVIFPDCWNGKALDSADHRSHLAYSTGRRCRASHPIALPTIALVVLYPPVAGAQVSSGPLSAHADFMNGWNQQELDRQVRSLNRRI